MIRRGSRRASWWVALVLPGLLLRALIPVGFMPVFDAQGVQLSMCDGYAPVASPTIDMPTDMPADMPMDMHTGGKSAHTLCPYGASPALASLPVLDEAPTMVPVSPQLRVVVAQITHFEIAPRTQSPRAPPVDARSDRAS